MWAVNMVDGESEMGRGAGEALRHRDAKKIERADGSLL